MNDIQDLSLFHLDGGLTELIDYRADRLADPESPPDAEELAAIDGQLREYVTAAIAKVDNVAGQILHWEAQLDTILGPKDPKTGTRKGGEIGRLKALAASIEAKRESLKGYVAEILERQPMPKKGPRKLVGATSELRLVGNGGLAPVKVDGWDAERGKWINGDPDLVPDELCMAEVKMPWKMWSLLWVAACNFSRLEIDQIKTTRVPNNSAIRAELAKDCPVCYGTGDVRALDWNPENEPVEPCGACGGSGHAGVAGAHLLERGYRVDVR